MTIKILIATHKKYDMPKNAGYMPIHVGAEGKVDLGYTCDNTGDNISLKNPYYCELTGLYWAWKNLEYDVLGLVHYRRYFGRHTTKENVYSGILSQEKIVEILKKYDCIVPKKRNYYIESVGAHFKNHVATYSEKDYFNYMLEAIKKNCPDYEKTFWKIVNKKSAHMCNMFIMKKEYVDSYCEWLFGMLEWMERYHSEYIGGDTFARIYGFMSEILFNVWIDYNCINKVEMPVFSTEKEDIIYKAVKLLGRKLFKIRFK